MPTPLTFDAPVRGLPSEYRHPIWHGKTRMAWLPDGEKVSKISLFVLTQLTNVIDTQTDTAWRHRPRLCIAFASRGKKHKSSSTATRRCSHRQREIWNNHLTCRIHCSLQHFCRSIKRGLYRHVCLSVRPSVTFVSCVKTNKRIIKNFSPSGSRTIRFSVPNGMAIFRRDPPP